MYQVCFFILSIKNANPFKRNDSHVHRLAQRVQLQTAVAGKTFRLFLLIVADDPELRRILGCAGVNHDCFCPFCDLRHSQWKQNKTRAKGNRKTIADMVRWGEETQRLVELLDLREAAKSNFRKMQACRTTSEEDLEKAKAKCKAESLECKKHFSQLTGRLLSTVTFTQMEEFIDARNGQRYPPLFPELTIFNYSACSLHCFLNLTTRTSRHTTVQLSGYPTVWLSYKQKLKDLHLHYLNAQVEKAEAAAQVDHMWKLWLIGRDCKTLVNQMPKLLQDLYSEFNHFPRASSLFEPLIAMWNRWAEVAPYLLKRTLANEGEIIEGKEKARLFIEGLEAHVEDEAFSYYLHLLHEHVWEWLEVYYKEFGFGLGVLSTQAGEHRLKLFKRETSHTLRNSQMWKMALTHQNQRLYGGLPDLTPPKRDMQCSTCHEKGHQSNNRKCPLFTSSNSNTDFDVDLFLDSLLED